MTSSLKIGIDFGTTNSSVALARGGAVELVQFPARAGVTESFRSVLYLEQQKGRVVSSTGPQAIEHYLEAEIPGRLIQSLKSYLPSRTLTGTEVFGRRYTLEDLIARIITDLRLGLERHLGGAVPSGASVTVGRPVRFVSAENDEDDAYATERLKGAFAQAGFPEVTFELEPVAAAFAYEATLDRDETILIGDFGGGTSDFSLLPVGPSFRGHREIIGNSGLGLAGDAFDARIVRKLVSPGLGADTLEKTYDNPFAPPAPKRFPGRVAALPPQRELKIIPAVPAWIYANLERWHYLSFLKTRNVTEILKAARARAEEPEKVASLITLIEEDLGYQLHQAVQRLKIELSRKETAEFRFPELDPTGSRGLRTAVTRAEFEGWIQPELEAIEGAVDGLLASSSMAAARVDKVFLTGGTSFVPAVRRIFETRFGVEKVVTGNEFTSVARGLALRA